MKDLLEFIVTSLVTKPDAVEINEQSQDGAVDLTLKVDPSDMGLIIGKSGQTIRAIRKLLTVRAIAENVRVNLTLIEPQGESRVGSPAEGEARQGRQESSENA